MDLKSRLKGISDVELIRIGIWELGLKAVQVSEGVGIGSLKLKNRFTSQYRTYGPTGGLTKI
jgi:hypothetical protein